MVDKLRSQNFEKALSEIFQFFNKNHVTVSKKNLFENMKEQINIMRLQNFLEFCD